MECLVGSIGVHLDAEFGFILTNKSFSSMFLGSKAAKSFFFHHILSLYLNTTFSTGEHNLALYTDHWNKVLSPGPWSWISLVCCIQLHKSRVLVDIKQLHFEFCNAITVCGYLSSTVLSVQRRAVPKTSPQLIAGQRKEKQNTYDQFYGCQFSHPQM